MTQKRPGYFSRQSEHPLFSVFNNKFRFHDHDHSVFNFSFDFSPANCEGWALHFSGIFFVFPYLIFFLIMLSFLLHFFSRIRNLVFLKLLILILSWSFPFSPNCFFSFCFWILINLLDPKRFYMSIAYNYDFCSLLITVFFLPKW